MFGSDEIKNIYCNAYFACLHIFYIFHICKLRALTLLLFIFLFQFLLMCKLEITTSVCSVNSKCCTK